MAWLPPPLETSRLILRSLAASPGEAHASLDEPEKLPGLPSHWSLIERSTGVVIGTIGFVRWDREHRSAEVGFLMAPSRRRSGLMTEALRAVLAFGFGPLGLFEIIASVQPVNTAAAALLEKLDFLRGETIHRALHSAAEAEPLVVFRVNRPR